MNEDAATAVDTPDRIGGGVDDDTQGIGDIGMAVGTSWLTGMGAVTMRLTGMRAVTMLLIGMRDGGSSPAGCQTATLIGIPTVRRDIVDRTGMTLAGTATVTVTNGIITTMLTRMTLTRINMQRDTHRAASTIAGRVRHGDGTDRPAVVGKGAGDRIATKCVDAESTKVNTVPAIRPVATVRDDRIANARQKRSRKNRPGTTRQHHQSLRRMLRTLVTC